MAITKADLGAIAPELLAVSDERFSFVLDLVGDEVDETTWGGTYKLAAALYAAHLLTITTSNRGAVTGETVGSISRSYASRPGAGGTGLESTSYGAEYRRLCRSKFGVWATT
jgi:hypothetical protein